MVLSWCKALTGTTLLLVGLMQLQTVNGQDDSLAGSFLSGKILKLCQP